MVKAENLSTFAKLISIVHYLMKQMILKYFYRSFGILLWVLMLSSCINSTSVEQDPIKDAQIYTFGIISKNDSNKYLNDTKFSIDQINGRIFNRDSLPYLFNVDSILLSISGTPLAGFSNIEVKLRDADSTFSWNGKDSVALHRLKSIETTAQDGKTILKYDISINIHQQDPYVFNWKIVGNNYITPSSIDAQRTIAFEDQFITYYKINGDIRATSATASNGNDWSSKVVSGLPVEVDLSSILVATHLDVPTLYCVDDNRKVFYSENGFAWSQINSDYPVEAIYGELPFVTGEYAILVSIEHKGAIKFATTDDFSSFDILNKIEDNMPVKDFTAVSINNPKVYSAKYIILCGGKDKLGVVNKKLWIIQEKDGAISSISNNVSMSTSGAKLFLYDGRVYMFVAEDDANKFYLSNNYGLTWTWGGINQVVDKDMQYRSDPSIVTDANNFMWVFGGESKTGVQIVDVWRGRLNKLAK